MSDVPVRFDDTVKKKRDNGPYNSSCRVHYLKRRGCLAERSENIIKGSYLRRHALRVPVIRIANDSNSFLGVQLKARYGGLMNTEGTRRWAYKGPNIYDWICRTLRYFLPDISAKFRI